MIIVAKPVFISPCLSLFVPPEVHPNTNGIIIIRWFANSACNINRILNELINFKFAWYRNRLSQIFSQIHTHCKNTKEMYSIYWNVLLDFFKLNSPAALLDFHRSKIPRITILEVSRGVYSRERLKFAKINGGKVPWTLETAFSDRLKFFVTSSVFQVWYFSNHRSILWFINNCQYWSNAATKKKRSSSKARKEFLHLQFFAFCTNLSGLPARCSLSYNQH